MGEPDFRALRAEVEAATRLPEFERLTGRARRIRRRDLGRRLTISLMAVVALLPVGIAGLNAAPGGGRPIQGNTQIGPDRPEPPSPSPSTAPVATIRAIAGSKLAALYAAVDVCRPAENTSTCSLQIVPIGATAQDQRGPIAVGELRAEATDPLGDVTLESVTPQMLLLSGIRRDGERKYRRISLGGGGAEIAPEPVDVTGPRPGDRAVQLRRYGELFFVRHSDAGVLRTPTQPQLKDVTLVTSVAPDDGWWVTGVHPVTGDAAVAVSRDLGRNWLVTSLGMRPGMSDPVLATGDGETAYVFVRTAAGIQQRRTTDGGLSWQPLTTPMPWPAFGSGGDVVGKRLGAVVRGDGSLLVWVEETPGAVFLESTDLGGSYHSVTGPSGPIVTVADGFAALGDPPVMSFDGRTWSPLPRPAVIPPG